jgi:hypothetical protein
MNVLRSVKHLAELLDSWRLSICLILAFPVSTILESETHIESVPSSLVVANVSGMVGFQSMAPIRFGRSYSLLPVVTNCLFTSFLVSRIHIYKWPSVDRSDSSLKERRLLLRVDCQKFNIPVLQHAIYLFWGPPKAALPMIKSPSTV